LTAPEQAKALVTGASRGLGRAIAIELARRGHHVLAAMRDVRAGADLADTVGLAGRIEVCALDVTRADDFDYPDDLHILVNNAGVRLNYLAVEQTTTAEWREVFETNVFGLVDVTRHVIPILRAARAGVICNVTSASTLTPLPFYSVYRASKWAVSAMTETMRTELAPWGIRVLEILPGPIDTDLLGTSVMFKVPEAATHRAYAPMAQRHFPASKFMDTSLIWSPAQAAVAVVDAIQDQSSVMRRGCDPFSVAGVDSWRHRSDEEIMTQAVEQFS
jgi:NAD(P)-dependent dehydrogenase (short-subunit alcohol dehydrogenase family)